MATAIIYKLTINERIYSIFSEKSLSSKFNTGLLTPEDQRWVNVLILSLQKIHAYPTQQITQEILQEFYTWFETIYLPSLQYSM